MRIFASCQCADYAHASYMRGRGQVRHAWHMLHLLYEKLFGVCSIQAAMAPLRRRPRPPSPLPKNVVVRDLRRAYLNVSDCVMHIWPIPMPVVYNDIPRDIPERHPPCTYIFCENRSSIQRLTLMHSAIIRSATLALVISSNKEART